MKSGNVLDSPPLTVPKAAEGSFPLERQGVSPRVGVTFTRPMSTKKRSGLSPAADLAEPEVDDAALRKAMGETKRAKSKAPFKMREVSLLYYYYLL